MSESVYTRASSHGAAAAVKGVREPEGAPGTPSRPGAGRDRIGQLHHMLTTRLKIKHFLLLTSIEQHRSLSRVALAMRLGQPAVSKALQDIEDIFMMRLFDRTPTGLNPTAAGAAVLKHAHAALADIGLTAQSLIAIETGLQSKVRVGFNHHAPEEIVSRALDHFLSVQPRVSVTVVEGVSSELLRDLKARELDVVIGRALPHDSTDLVQIPLLRQDPCLLVASGSLSRLSRGPLDWSKLAALDWILQPHNTAIRKMIDATFANAGIRNPQPLVETYSLRAMKETFRRQPNAITILAKDMASKLVEAGVCRILPHELNWTLPPICLLLSKSSAALPLYQSLCTALVDAGRNDPRS